jgi:hypothetical protein
VQKAKEEEKSTISPLLENVSYIEALTASPVRIREAWLNINTWARFDNNWGAVVIRISRCCIIIATVRCHRHRSWGHNSRSRSYDIAWSWRNIKTQSKRCTASSMSGMYFRNKS